MTAPQGVTIITSPYPVNDTIDRFQEFLLQHGATIYARINQQAEVKKVGQTLLPLEFIMFGNPKAGWLVMIENPVAALDLPLKIIAWQDNVGKVWVAYNQAAYIEDRYGLKHNDLSPLQLDKLVALVLGN